MKKHRSLFIALAGLLSVGMFAIAVPVPAAHAAPTSGHTTITRSLSGATASSAFFFEQGDVMGFVGVDVALNGFQGSPTPIFGPAVEVIVSEFNNTTQESFFGIGVAPAPGLQIDKKLSGATLPAITVPIAAVDKTGNLTGGTLFDVQVATVTWTGAGPITFQTINFHTRIPHVVNETMHGKGSFRQATVSGTISYPSPLAHTTITLGSSAVNFADLSNTRLMTIVIQH